MRLHIFNPEHDIALAYNRRRQTMPHAAQELRMNLGWLPALWADDGDVVLVDDALYAVKAAAKWKDSCRQVLFLQKEDLRGIRFDEVLPWGWDLRVRTELVDAGVECAAMPSEKAIQTIRALSSRQHTAHLLPALRSGIEEQTCGSAEYVGSVADVERLRAHYGKIVVKAPWSSSGRGVRFVVEALDDTLRGWVEHVIQQQGGVMVEPLYAKVRDFAFEFCALADGRVEYRGLSLFETRQQTYIGNILACEDEKRRMLSRYLSPELLDEIICRLENQLSKLLNGAYVGPLGVDLMIVRNLIHPCVEVNLRRTMGHVALAFNTLPTEPTRVMTIIHDVNYKLKTNYLENNYVQVL